MKNVTLTLTKLIMKHDLNILVADSQCTSEVSTTTDNTGFNVNFFSSFCPLNFTKFQLKLHAEFFVCVSQFHARGFFFFLKMYLLTPSSFLCLPLLEINVHYSINTGALKSFFLQTVAKLHGMLQINRLNFIVRLYGRFVLLDFSCQCTD